MYPNGHDDEPETMNRRSVLRAIGAGGAASVGITGAASAKPSEKSNSLNIVDTEKKAGEDVYTDLQTLVSQDQSRDLVSVMEQEGNVRVDPSIFPIGMDITTDNRRVNKHNPRLVVMFAPAESDTPTDVSTADQANKRPSEVEFGLRPSQSLRSARMGMVFGLSVDKTPSAGGGHPGRGHARGRDTGRIVTHALGLSTHGSDSSRTLSTNNAAGSEVRYYGASVDDPSEDGSRGGNSAGRRPGVSTVKTKEIPDITVQGGGISTFSGGCWISDENCADVLRIACAGAGATLSQGACIEAAITAGVVGGGPIGSALAYGFYQALISWYGQAICQTQADEVCSGFINSACDDGDDGDNCLIPFDPTCP